VVVVVVAPSYEAQHRGGGLRRRAPLLCPAHLQRRHRPHGEREREGETETETDRGRGGAVSAARYFIACVVRVWGMRGAVSDGAARHGR